MDAPSELSESLRRTLDTVRAGFQVIGPDWKYLYVNPAAAAHGRRRVEELIGRTMLEVYPGIEQTAVFAMLRQALIDRRAGGGDNLFTFPDGESRWFELRVEPVPEGVCVYSIDIHDRKIQQLSLEQRIAELEQRQMSLSRRLWRSIAGKQVEDEDGWIL